MPDLAPEGSGPVVNQGGNRVLEWVAVGFMALVCLTCGVGLALDTMRDHVRVEVRAVNDLAQVFVNCRQVGPPLYSGGEVDPGLLKSDDLLTVQVRNQAGDYDADIRVMSSGHPTITYRTPAQSNGDLSRTHRVVLARTSTASNRRIGQIGCFQSHPALASARAQGSYQPGFWASGLAKFLVAAPPWLFIPIMVLGGLVVFQAQPSGWKLRVLQGLSLASIFAALGLGPTWPSVGLLVLAALLLVGERILHLSGWTLIRRATGPAAKSH